jgi:hypothetical protein
VLVSQKSEDVVHYALDQLLRPAFCGTDLEGDGRDRVLDKGGLDGAGLAGIDFDDVGLSEFC